MLRLAFLPCPLQIQLIPGIVSCAVISRSQIRPWFPCRTSASRRETRELSRSSSARFLAMTDARTVRQGIQVRTGSRSTFVLTLTTFSRMGQLERKSRKLLVQPSTSQRERVLKVERKYSWECFFACDVRPCTEKWARIFPRSSP